MAVEVGSEPEGTDLLEVEESDEPAEIEEGEGLDPLEVEVSEELVGLVEGEGVDLAGVELEDQVQVELYSV